MAFVRLTFASRSTLRSDQGATTLAMQRPDWSRGRETAYAPLQMSTVSLDSSAGSWHTSARSILVRAGVPEGTLTKAETHGAVNWEPLAVAIDDMFIVGLGEITQMAFLRSNAGHGLTALELLERPGGAKRVYDAARRWLQHRS